MTNQVTNLLSQTVPDANITDERTFKLAWQSIAAPKTTPIEQAFTGGMLADRFAFLFIAGYQSAIRHCFGVEGNRWSAFAVSEDRSEENPLPGLTLKTHEEPSSYMTLSGYKTWIAACNSIDELIVTAVDKTGTTHLYRIDREREGIEIIPRTEPPAFLSEMSQGTAHFENVTVSDDDRPDAARLKAFASTEPLYLYLAFAGFLHANAPDHELDTLITDLTLLASEDLRDKKAREVFAHVDTRIQALMKNLPADCFQGKFENDRSLIGLYSKGIQKRAARP